MFDIILLEHLIIWVALNFIKKIKGGDIMRKDTLITTLIIIIFLLILLLFIALI